MQLLLAQLMQVSNRYSSNLKLALQYYTLTHPLHQLCNIRPNSNWFYVGYPVTDIMGGVMYIVKLAHACGALIHFSIGAFGLVVSVG